jgi:Methyltransferase domain
MVPSNVSFIIDDVEDEWVDSSTYDFIHCRYMSGAILDWPALMKRIYQHTAPGGWVEFSNWDMVVYSQDGTVKEDSNLYRQHILTNEACDKMGREPSPGPRFKKQVENEGFTNIHHEIFQVPMGLWPKDKRMKEMGAFNLMQYLDGVEAFTLALYTRVLKWSYEEVQLFLVEVRKEAQNPRVHSQYDCHVVYAQKPAKEEEAEETSIAAQPVEAAVQPPATATAPGAIF